MKKSTLILSAMMLGTAAFTANAQSKVFIAGNFNDFNPNGNTEWALEAIDENGTYRGTFDLKPASEIQFNIVNDGVIIVPGISYGEDTEPAEKNVDVVWDGGFFEGAAAADGTMSEYVWVIENWEGGELEVTWSSNEQFINLSKEVAQEETSSDLFISGSFNEYAPEGLEIWALTSTEAEGTYRGTFTIAAAEEVSFHLEYNGISLVPGIENEGEVEAAEADVTVELEDGFYSGSFASTGVAKSDWVIKNWEGGNLEVTVDFEEGTIILSLVEGESGQQDEADMFISGNFNEYAPEGLEIWALTSTEAEGTYRGTFTIAAQEELSFHLEYNGISLVPGIENEGEVEATEADVTVELEDGFYSGSFASTGVAKTNWVIKNWEGGDLEVTVDFEEGTIILSVGEGESEPGEADMFISGTFNEYAPEGLEIWALTVLDENSYRGTFTIAAADEVSFHLEYNGISLVPGVENEGEVEAAEADVTVELEDGFYSGLFTSTGVAKTNWVIKNWEGGDLEVTVDFEEGTISLSAVEGEPEVANIFVAGNFNDYAPEGLEIWALGTEDGEVYEGVFTIPAREDGISFYLAYETLALVPGVEEVVEGVEDLVPATENVVIEDTYTGVFTATGLANVYWTFETWEGGNLEVSVNFTTGNITISQGETSGINNINASNLNDGVIYNLQGVRVDANKLAKGIYIINGKKVMVK